MEDSGKSRLQHYQKLKELIDSGDNDVSEFEKVATELRKLGNEQDDAVCDQIIQTARLRSGHCDTLLSKFEQGKNKDPFSYIYTLHALDKQNSALTNIDALNIDKSDYHTSMLYAQILYKLDQREKAAESFETILNSNDSHIEHDHNEIIVNLLASLWNSNGLNEERIKGVEKLFTGEINSDFAFNSAASYASLEGWEKVASKKLKESYQLAKESGEENNHKFLALSTYLAAKLFLKQHNLTEFDESELKFAKEEPTKFDNALNDLAYLNNTVCIKSHLNNVSDKDINRLAQKITENLKKKELNQYQSETLFFNLLNIYMNKNKVGDAKKLLGDASIQKDESLQRRCDIISLL